MDHLLMVLLMLWSSGLWAAGQHNSAGAQCETTHEADIMLLLDTTLSTSSSTFQDMKNFLMSIVSVFDIGPDRVQIGLKVNGGSAWMVNTHQTKESLLEAITNVQMTYGMGSTRDLVISGLRPNVGMRTDSQKIAVLITDRESQDEVFLSSPSLKDSGIEVYAIGVKDAVETELRSIASEPHENHMYYVMDSRSLQDIADNLTINLCNSANSTSLDSVRLVNGTSLCSGRLKVKSNQSNQSNQWWSSVCEDDFDQQDAEVVCRELGCGAPSVLQGALYGEMEAPMWTEKFQCEGNESALLDCRRSGSPRDTCSSGKAVGLTCWEPIRLVGGACRCAGTLELKHLGEWRPVYNYWDLKSAAVICRDLDCGSFVSKKKTDETSNRPAWWVDDECALSGYSLSECVSSSSSSVSSAMMELTCSDSVRLVNGTSLCSGRLEVKSNQSDQSNQWWSSVCEDDFDQQDAEVVCRELGCGAPSVLQGALYGEVEAPMWTEKFQCEGNESALLDCRRSGSPRDTCSPGKAVGLTCWEPVRLVGGASRCAGELEVKHLGEWRPVVRFDSNLKSAAAICRDLDCGSATSTRTRGKSSNRPAWQIDSNCPHYEYSRRECVTQSSDRSIQEIVIQTCLDSVRLVNGTSLCSGRLEVKSNQSDQSNQPNQWWSSVCEDDFDQQDAEVVCRELGCGAPSVLQGALYGEVEAPMWTEKFQCEGNESALLDCRRSGSARNTCSPGKAVGLTCSELVRLVGGASRCAGTLQLKHQGEWRPVCSYNWDLKSADVICRDLDCGSAASTRSTSDVSAIPAWVHYSCDLSKYSLRDCVSLSVSSTMLEITCLGVSSDPVHISRLVVLPLALLLLIAVVCVTLKVTRAKKLGPQENMELDYINLGAGGAEGGPAEEGGARAAE